MFKIYKLLLMVVAQHNYNKITLKRCDIYNNLVPFSIFQALLLGGVEKGIFFIPNILNLIYETKCNWTRKYPATNWVKQRKRNLRQTYYNKRYSSCQEIFC